MPDRQASATAEHLQRIVSALLHALAGPLQTIDGFSLILQEDYADRPLDLEGWEHLQRIRNDTARMRVLLDDLSEYLRILTAEVEPEWVDATTLVREIAARLAEDDPERQVEWSIAPDLQVYADPALLHGAFDRLLQNAWKFSRDSAPARIEIGRDTVDEAEGVFVRDNGVGFNEKYTKDLFTPFKRLHHQTEFAGTGMGLSIVQEIVQRHQGRIVATGTLGQGSTFTMYFPPA